MANLINGTATADTLQGTADADTINPLGGVDIVNALGGDDTINHTQVAENGQNFAGGEGNDTLNITGAAAAQTLNFYADSDVDSAGTFTDSASSGTADAIKFDSLFDGDVDGNGNASTVRLLNTGLITITQEDDGDNNDMVITAKGVEKIIYTNGEIDLTNPNEQYLAATTTAVGLAEAATSAALVDADVVSFTLGATDADSAYDATEGTAAAAKITAIAGVAVTKDATYALTGKLANYEVVVGGTQTTMTLNAKSNVDAEDIGIDVSEAVEVTFTAANGDTFTKKYTFTDAYTEAGDDTVSGTSGNDIINSDAGNDVIKASAGNDTLLGGAGTDSVSGGAGNDSLDGGDANDTLNGGAGDDVIFGGAGDDIAQYSGAITSGAKLNTTTSTIEGTDTISATTENVAAKNLGQSIWTIEMQGRNGTDGAGVGWLNVDDQAFVVLSGMTTDDTIGGVTSSTVAGGGSTDVYLGDDLLKYTASTDLFATVTGETNLDDWNISGYAFQNGGIQSATKGATVDTGAGKITFTSLDLEDSVQLTHTAASNATSGDVKKDLVIEITNGTEKRHIVVELTHSGDNEVKTGTDAAESLSGGVGDDNYKGAGGNDTLDGGQGADTLDGGTGDDKLLGGDDNDKITGGDGNDTGNGGDGNDTIDGGKGNDAFYAGTDDNGDDSLVGGEGDDTLGGGEGRDTIDGGVGSNLIFGGDDADTITLTSGDDSLEGASTGWAGKGNDSVTGGVKDDTIGGGEGNDTINSGDGNDVIYGGKTGDETIDAGKGNDVVYASTDRDTVTAGDGDDTVFGGDGKDSITGGAGADQLWGGADNDTIDGGTGNDTIDSAAGNDSLTGGSGADTFTFKTGDGADTISDFKTADGDVLDLSGFGLTDTNILSYAQEQTVTGSTGIILNLGNNDSIFLASVTLSQIRDANIVWTDSAS